MFGVNPNKRDGALMCSGADWKNANQSATNKASPMKALNEADQKHAKDRKYGNLQSSVFGGGYLDGETPAFNPEAGRNVCGSTADWKSEAVRAKPQNAATGPVDTFGARRS